MRKTIIAVCCAISLTVTMQAQDLKLKTNEKGLVGFVDASGTFVVPCKYEAAFPFENGVAVVMRKGKTGAVDASGKEVVPLKYDEILPWGNNLLLLKKGKKMGLAKNTGEELLKAEYSNISRPNCYGLAWVSVDGKITSSNGKSVITGAKFGIVNADGGIVIPAEYKGLAEFNQTNVNAAIHEGAALGIPVMIVGDTLQTAGHYYGFGKENTSSSEYGIIDSSNKVLIKNGEFSVVMEPRSGMVRAYNAKSKKTECFYYNIETGKTIDVAELDGNISAINYWTHGDFNGALAPVNSTDGWYFIDKEGNRKMEGFSGIKHGQKAKLWAAYKESDGTCQVLDEDGNKALPEGVTVEDIVFSENTSHQDVFPVKQNGKYGIIDRQGKTVLPFDYTDAQPITFDYVYAKKDSGWGCVKLDGTAVVPFDYSNIYAITSPDNKAFWCKKADNLYYIYNVEDKQEKTTGYKYVSAFNGKYAWASLPGTEPEDTPLMRGMIGKNVTDEVFQQNKEYYGQIVGEDGTVYAEGPLWAGIRDKAFDLINKAGGRPLTKSWNKKMLLYLTRNARSYKMGTVIDDADWDF